MRGSIDHVDYVDTPITNESFIKKELDESLYERLLVYTKNQEADIMGNIGEAGYLIYSLLFYGIVNICLKVVNFGVFLWMYRRNTIAFIKKKEYEKRKMKFDEKMKKNQ